MAKAAGTGIDLSNPRRVGELLARHGVWLTKAMGQHLLVDRDVLARIVDAAAISRDDEVLEVGPGAGVLTAALATRAARVVAVELDKRLLAVLRDAVRSPVVEVVQGDALQLRPDVLFGHRPYKLVSNLPYGVATPLIRRLASAPPGERPSELVVMVQREVAVRLAAQPGDMSLLSVQVQLVADVEYLFSVPPEAFFPPPDVDSAVVRLRPLPQPRVAVLPDERRFFQTAMAGFGQKRKQLHNALGVLGVGTERIDAALAAAGVAPARRAETLSLEEWSRLSAALWRRESVSGQLPPA